MGCKTIVVFLCVLLLVVTEAKIEINSAWKPHFGWEVACSWTLFVNDTLQSVRLFRNGHQYVVFRPEVNGQQLSQELPAQEFLMKIDCKMADGQRGRCVTSLYLYTAATEDKYTCEVSGERPTFRLETKDHDAFVPPSDAEVEKTSREGSVDRKVLNCTSSGVPTPTLVWTVDGERIPSDFKGAYWNSSTKLWHSWSTYSPPADGPAAPVCTPEVITKDMQFVTAKGYIANGVKRLGATKSAVAVIIISTLLR